MQTNPRRRLLLLLYLGVVLSTQGQVVSVWDGSASTAWEVGANWDPADVGPVPGSTGIARFNAVTPANPTLNGDTAIGRLEFLSGTDAKTIGGSATLTINGVSGNGITNSSGVSASISPAIMVGATQSWTTSGSGSDLTFTNSINLGGRVLTIDAGDGTTINFGGAGEVSNGSLIKNGTGTLALDGAGNSFAGGVTLNAGTLQIGNDTALGSGNLTLGAGVLSATADRTLANNLVVGVSTSTIGAVGGIDFTFSGTLTGGNGDVLNLVNTNSTGVMSVGFSNAALTYNRGVNVGADTELRFTNASGTQVFSGAITGTGDLVRDMAGGTTTISGTNTSFSGDIFLTAGTLNVGSASALGTTSPGTLVLNGGTLTATADRTIANAVSVTDNSVISAANGIDFTFSSGTISGSAGTLSLTNTSGTGTMSVAFSGSGFDFDRSLSLGAFTELRFSNTSGTQTFSDVISGDGTIRRSGAGGTVVLTGDNTFTGLLTIAAGTLQLGAAGGDTNTPLGTTDAGTVVSATGAALDLNGFTLGTAEALTITGTGVGANGALTNSGGAASYNGVVTLGNAATIGGAGDITLTSGLAGNFVLTKSGSGTLALDAASARTAGTTVSAGTLVLGNDTALGTGALTLGAGTLSSAADRTLANNLVVGEATSTIGAVGGIDFTFSGTLTGGTGDVLNLVNTNSTGVMSAAFSNTALSYNRGFNLNADTELRFTNTSGTQVFSGAITGTGDLVRNTAGGTTTISGTNTSFSGDIILTAGTLNVGSASALGTTSPGTLVLNGGTLTATADRTIANAVSVTDDSVISAANGTDFTFSSGTVGGTAGSLSLTNTSGSGTMSVAFSGSGFDFDRSLSLGAFTELRATNTTGTQTLSGELSGSGTIRRNGAGGVTIITGSNSLFTGNVFVDAGTLEVGHDSALGTATLTLRAGTLTSNSDRTLAGSVVVDDPGAIVTGANGVDFTFSGPMTAGAGGDKLSLVNSSGTGVMSLSLAGSPFSYVGGLDLGSATELRFTNTTGTQTYSGVITGTGNMVRNGVGGTTLLSGANTAFAGNILLTAGTLNVGNAAALGTTSPGTLILGGGTLTAAADRTLANPVSLTASSAIEAAANIDFIFSSNLVGGSAGTLTLTNTTGSGAMSVGFNNSGFDLGRDIALGAFTELRSLNTGGTQTFSGIISGSGLVRQTGAGGVLVLAGSNSFDGATVIAAGTLLLGASGNATNTPLGTTAAGTTVSATGAALDLNGFTLGTAEALSIAGTGVSSAGALTNSGGAASFSGAVTLGNTATIGGSGDITLSSGLAGNFTLTKAGSGTLTLNAASGRTAANNITAGVLAVGHDSALGTGAIDLGAATLSATADRTLANNLNVSSASATVGNAAGVDLVLSSNSITGTASSLLSLVNTSGSGTMSVSFTGSALTYNRAIAIDANSELRFANTAGTQTFSGELSGSGTLVRATAGGETVISGANTTFSGNVSLSNGAITVADDDAFGTGTLLLAGGTLKGTATHTLANAVTVSADSIITGDANTNFIFSSDAIGGPAGKITLANSAGSGLTTVGFAGANVSLARDIELGSVFTQVRFLNTAGAQTYAGVISGPGSVRDDGAGGTVVLAGENSYAGTTTVAGGTLKLGSAGNGTNSALGTTASGTTVAAGGSLDLNGITLSTAEALTLSGDGVGAGGALTNSGAAASFSGVVTLDANATIGTPGDITLTAGLAGNFTLTKVGAGVLALNGPSTRNDDTQVDAGTLRLGNSTALGAATGTLTLNGGTLDLAIDTSVASHDVIVNATSTIVSNKATPASAGIDHTLDALNLNNGSTLSVTAGGNVGSGTAGAVFDAATLGASGAVFDVGAGASLSVASISGNTRSFTATGAGNMTVTGGITTTTGAVTKAGAGTLTLAGASTYSGSTTINEGVLSLQHNNGLGTVGGSTTVSGTGAALELSNVAHGNLTTLAEPLFLSGTGVGGNGALRNAAGTNVFAGSITLNADSLIAADAGTALTLTGTLTSAGHDLTLGTTANSGDVTFSAAVNLGSGGLTKDGAGNLTLSAASSYTGNTAINAGTLTMGANSVLPGQTAMTLSAGATFNLANTTQTVGSIAGAGAINLGSGALTAGGNNSSTTYSGVMSGTGSFTKDGSGTLTLTGSNSYSGATTVTEGTLVLGGSAVLDGSTSLTISSGGALTLNAGLTNSIAGLNAAASSTLTIGAGATLTIDSASPSTLLGDVLGTGTLIFTGGGDLTLGNNMDFADGTLVFGGTTIGGTPTSTLYLGSNPNIGTLHITGDTILDFGSSTASVLTTANFEIDAGVKISINNWVEWQDYFFAQDWVGAVPDEPGAGAAGQVDFADWNTPTKWQSWDQQITPTPEPSTYGAILTGALAVALAWWRRRTRVFPS